MSRTFPSLAAQLNAHTLRNRVCRLASPQEMAQVSSHLRNYTAAQVIGIVGRLDSHPRILGRPTIGRDGAAFQQATGTRPNPFTHVGVCNLLLNGQNLTEFFATAKARDAVELLLGRGVMAPDNWADLNSFPVNPAQLNAADHRAEGFAREDGLVAALEKTANAAAASGAWDGSGRQRHNASSLLDYVTEYYRKTWKPAALFAYEGALSHLNTELSLAAKSGNGERKAKLGQRIAAIDTQIAVLNADTPNLAEAVRGVLAATGEERWS